MWNDTISLEFKRHGKVFLIKLFFLKNVPLICIWDEKRNDFYLILLVWDTFLSSINEYDKIWFKINYI